LELRTVSHAPRHYRPDSTVNAFNLLLQAVVDPFEPPLPARVKAEQALHFAE
jgi:hypothetical protein